MITYADQPLLLEDPEYRLSGWMDRAWPLDDLRLFTGDPVALSDGRTDARSTALAKVGLPTANWQFPPRLKINTLWWPTGAARWSIGLFLCDTSTLDRIQATIAESGGFGTLKLTETGGGGREISTSMALLPPRSITMPADTDLERLWLLPLVDDRYFWQSRDAGELVITIGDTWAELFAHLAARLGISLTVGTIDPCYYYPDPVEFTRRYENAALLLDAAAWCTGRRIVRHLDGTVTAERAAVSKLTLGDNLQGTLAVVPASGWGMPWDTEAGTVWAGGLSSHNRIRATQQAKIPETVRVVYPRYAVDEPCDSGQLLTVDSPASRFVADSSLIVSGRTKTFHNTAMAVYDSACTAGPYNSSKLIGLTTQIAYDYYAWLDVETYDLTYTGLMQWDPNGFDDAIWWHWGAMQPAGDPDEKNLGMEGGAPYAAYTRVSSLPEDWGYSELLHQFDIDPEELIPTSTTTTTTTTNPSIGPCAGRCKWTWDAATDTWSLTTDGCSTNTSTTTSTTTTGAGSSTTTTTTTPDPCGYASTTTTTTTTADPATTTTTSSTTTTTTTTICSCDYPTECGDGDGECVFTFCSSIITSHPDCGTTTTSTTTTTTTTYSGPATTTTTTADPCLTTTTTTLGPQCSDGCDWIWVPQNYGWHWVKTSDGCDSDCPCSTPENPGAHVCATEHTPCVPVPPPPPPPPPTCTGSCLWYWKASTSAWHRLAFGCLAGGGVECTCDPPSVPGDDCADLVSTPCGSRTSTTTTTTTTEHPCYTTTTTSTTSTTTTTGPCSGGCKYQWDDDASVWVTVLNTCDSSCPCPEPPFTGIADCEVLWVDCGFFTTTTTTTTTPGPTTTTTTTTSTTTTTTTTHCPLCSGCSEPENCVYECAAGIWVLIWTGGCGDGGCVQCVCDPPTVPCTPAVEGQHYGAFCCDTGTTPAPTTTTTPGPTTTTTTSSTTTSTTTTPDPGTTTTSTTTTTTTTCAAWRTCSYICSPSALCESGWAWIFDAVSDDCRPECPCPAFDIGPCCTSGQSWNPYSMTCGSTTTTGGPTTSTTTSTTTTI